MSALTKIQDLAGALDDLEMHFTADMQRNIFLWQRTLNSPCKAQIQSLSALTHRLSFTVRLRLFAPFQAVGNT